MKEAQSTKNDSSRNETDVAMRSLQLMQLMKVSPKKSWLVWNFSCLFCEFWTTSNIWAILVTSYSTYRRMWSMLVQLCNMCSFEYLLYPQVQLIENSSKNGSECKAEFWRKVQYLSSESYALAPVFKTNCIFIKMNRLEKNQKLTYLF